MAPDGRRVATGSFDNSVGIWDATNGEVSMKLVGHRFNVRVLCFAPGGTVLMSWGADATFRFWDLTSGTELAEAEFEPEVLELAFAADERAAVAYTATEVVRWSFGDSVSNIARAKRDATGAWKPLSWLSSVVGSAQSLAQLSTITIEPRPVRLLESGWMELDLEGDSGEPTEAGGGAEPRDPADERKPPQLHSAKTRARVDAQEMLAVGLQRP
ncbi:hypothetical protein HK405_012797 [Cladochytrium tenue]|nr:hypothetical protein HK405_012797 [Cladochytrium tenue]